MAKFFKIIGTPFIKIWTWIKETAWVQPLLIVGIIFAIIFSIPSITSWVQSWNFGSDTYTFLKNRQLSLEGITGEDNNGQAYDFFVAFNKAQNEWATDRNAAKNTMKQYTNEADKLIVYFVNEDETGQQANEATNYLVNENWSSVGENVGAFQYQTIFADQTIETDDDTYRDETPFEKLFILPEYQTFVEQAATVAITSPYFKNKVSKAEDISSLETNAGNLPDPNNFSTQIPYYVIIDLTDTNKTENIITNVFFEITGANKFERANFIAHAWTNTEEFAITQTN